jgi:hypothetical protein
MILDLL